MVLQTCVCSTNGESGKRVHFRGQETQPLLTHRLYDYSQGTGSLSPSSIKGIEEVMSPAHHMCLVVTIQDD